jgi:signal transduction histidine kinase
MISSQSPLILVVDDDDGVRQTLIDILELNGFKAVGAANGADGLVIARSHEPALVITDIEMPRMTGFELLQHMRSDEALRATPVVVVSVRDGRASTRYGMELGADDFITKPFTEHEVIRSIRARLEKKELLDELDAFAHTVAHDLKNPLATLNGRIGLLDLTLGTGDEAALRKHLGEARYAAHRLGLIIDDDILMLAGVRRQQVVPEPLDTNSIVREAVDRLEELLSRTGATVHRPDRWPAAVGHASWIVHVWSNYISNAAKYGGPKAEITLGADMRPSSGRVRFWVQDRGPGLGAAAQASLFVPFARISTGRGSGHGLGLSIVMRIVEKLGGQVGVENEPGKGARFWFELPALASAQCASSATSYPQIP